MFAYCRPLVTSRVSLCGVTDCAVCMRVSHAVLQLSKWCVALGWYERFTHWFDESIRPISSTGPERRVHNEMAI